MLLEAVGVAGLSAVVVKVMIVAKVVAAVGCPVAVALVAVVNVVG